MIYKIVNKIYNDMITGVGPSSSYATNKIENVYINLPKTVTGTRILSVEYGSKEAGEYEIGQRLSFNYFYNVNIVIAVKHSSELDALNLLDILENRVLLTLSTSTITSEEDSSLSPIVERVLSVKLLGADYEDLYKDTDLMYGIRLRLRVETQLETG